MEADQKRIAIYQNVFQLNEEEGKSLLVKTLDLQKRIVDLIKSKNRL